MNAATATDVATIPRIKHAEAMQLAAEENRRFAAALRALQPADWTLQTDCARWDVKALAAHVIGSAAGQASPASSSGRCAPVSRSSRRSEPSTGGTV